MPRKIPASLTKAYNRAIKQQGGAAERAVRAALTEYIAENPNATVEEIREYAIELLKSAGELYGNACSQVAFELQDEITREFGTKPPDVGGWYYEPDAESIEWTARYHAQKLVDGDVDGFVKEMAEAARFYAERGANATMVETAKKQDRDSKRSKRTGAVTHGVTFARVPQGATTCEFCLMLASRGFVYLSEESAGEFDRFHKHCDCRIVPGYPGMELEGYDPDEYYDMWKHPEKYQRDAGGFEEAAWKKEKDVRTREEIRVATSVNRAIVESKEYSSNMKRLVGAQWEKFLDASKKALEHRDGTLFEDLYAINLDNGKSVSVLNSHVPQEVNPSKGMNSSIEKWKKQGERFAMIHNHPESGIPSMKDIRAIRDRGAEFGVIVGHDGSMYKYSIVGEPTPPKTLDNDGLFDYIENRRKINRPDEGTFANVERDYGVRIEFIPASANAF